jgi:hypothetical protein
MPATCSYSLQANSSYMQLLSASKFLLHAVILCKQIPATCSYSLQANARYMQLLSASKFLLHAVTLCKQIPATCSYSLQSEHPVEAVRFWRRLLFKLWSSFGFLQGEAVKCSDVSERHTASVFRVTQCNIWNSLSLADSRIGSQDQSRIIWYHTRLQKSQDHPRNNLCHCFSQFYWKVCLREFSATVQLKGLGIKGNITSKWILKLSTGGAWIDLDQDREKCQAVGNAVMNYRVT